MLLKPFDFGIAVPVLAAVIFSFFFSYSGADGGRLVNLKADGGEWVFPADADETAVVSGPLGDTVIEISGGRARITSSPCLNQTCVAAGAITLPGQWTACLPNRVMLYISEGRGENDVDAAAW
ncbi:MAG: NusG domain II-containing protein [Treponema sp.]|nr:NusG domain II-containing protein [Treponema sp.]